MPPSEPPAPSDPHKEIYRPSVTASRARTSGAPGSGGRRSGFVRGQASFPLRKALTKGLLRLFWDTCRITQVVGAEHLDGFIARGEPVIFAYWHQMHLFCSRYLLEQIPRGLASAFLISPSRSGDVGASIVEDYGGRVLRGSDTRTGGQALQQLHRAIAEQRWSPVLTLDGPRGPAQVCKPGAILLARLTGTPLLPMAYAAKTSRYMNTWDRFVLPMPFTRIAIAIGAPVTVARDTTVAAFEGMQRQIGAALTDLERQAKAALAG